MRRIVVGHDGAGQARVLQDRDIEPITLALLPGAELHRMWELDEPARLPLTEIPQQPYGRYFPGPGGLRFGFIRVPPGLTYEPPADWSEAEFASAAAEADAKLPGMMDTFDTARPGAHATATVDFVVVLRGRGRMRVGDGIDVPLSPGDCVVQNGALHAWFNDGTEPFVFCYTLCGAH